jgi:hypothetical protein
MKRAELRAGRRERREHAAVEGAGEVEREAPRPSGSDTGRERCDGVVGDGEDQEVGGE